LDAVDQFSKGTSKVVHQLALLQAENRDLRKANETLSKRCNRKKSRLQVENNIAQFIIGRLLVGGAVGTISAAVPVWQS
jgi:hypothetical protein